MAKIMSRMMKRDERGMALLVALFALLLLSGIGLCMVLASTTETRIDANYGGSLRSYYAAHSGLEEVRDRISYPSSTSASTGLANHLPIDIAGNPNGVLYVLNPDGGETVNPTDPTSPYFDVQLCHDYNSGVTIRDSRCTAVPATTNWMMPSQNAAPPASPAAVPPGYKWVRINMKTNRIAAPYFVDQQGDPATLDTRICWDGKTEQLSPGGAYPLVTPTACCRFICSPPWLWHKARGTCCALKWWGHRFVRPAPSPWTLAVPPALPQFLQLLMCLQPLRRFRQPALMAGFTMPMVRLLPLSTPMVRLLLSPALRWPR